MIFVVYAERVTINGDDNNQDNFSKEGNNGGKKTLC